MVFGRLWETALDEVARRDLDRPALRQRLAQETGEDACGCIIASLQQQPAALVAQSASLLAGLTLLWASARIEPDDIWMELHKRERLGSLLHEMASGEPRPKRSSSRPWRVDSTKLP